MTLRISRAKRHVQARLLRGPGRRAERNEAELKSAFRKLAMQHHPDRNPGDKDCEHKFKEINEAYDVLKDGDKRAAYDRFGHAAFEQGGRAAHGFGADFASTFADIFDDLFGMGGGRGAAAPRPRARRRPALQHGNQPRRGLRGKTAQIRIPTSVTCEACSGTGAKAGTKPKTCATCGGAGKIRHAQGFFTLERTCPVCQGRGQVIDDPCPSCSGSGRVTRERTLSVNIPPGVEDGTRIRLAGEGEAGLRGGPAGRPLYLPLAHPARVLSARRRRPALPGADLHGDGGAGRRFRGAGHRRQQGAGQGAGRHPDRPPLPPVGQGHAGAAIETDRRHVRSVVVETPQNLTKRQRELLAEFEKLSSEDTQPESAGFFRRVKEFLDGLEIGRSHTG